MIKKNDELEVEIIDNGYEGEGIARIDDFTIFVQGAIKGEKVKVLIVKVLSSYAYGKVIELINKSENRIDIDCSTYKRCGGCNLRHIKYSETLNIKRNIVQNLVNKNLSKKVDVKNVIGMDNPYQYRNKAQYPVGYDRNNKLVYGVFAGRSHEIIPIEKCYIQKSISEDIANSIIEFMNRYGITAYDEKTRKGLIRHIVTKVGIRTDEVMLVLVINGDSIPEQDKLLEVLLAKFKQIKTIVLNVNNENTNVIMGKKNIVVYGEGYIYDKLENYIFKISPLSFYQINPVQTEKLYKKAVEVAKLNKNDIVLDLYCGIGTISIFVADYVKQVFGVEIVKQAVEDARQNAKLNGINNVEFVCGDVEEILEGLLVVEHIKPDVIFVDPPRKGLDSVSIGNIIKAKPERLVYISCNPATLMRDLAMLENMYDLKEIQPVDMFPFTSHVECVAVLQLKENM